MNLSVDPVGVVIALALTASICATLYVMLHPPANRTINIARRAATQAATIAGDVLVVFSEVIQSEVLMALAAKMAKRQEAQLVAIYIIEVPQTLPLDAELPQAERRALEVLQAAQEIGTQNGLEVKTRTIRVRDRGTGTAIINAASEEKARLIVMGAYREQAYAGAPIGKTIDYVMTNTKTDVLVGVSSNDEETMFNLAR